MKKFLFLSVLSILSFITVSAQQAPPSRVLPMLGVRDASVEAVLKEVSTYISKKPKGLRFPISKVLFQEVKGGFSYQITGIDNSWSNLFNYGEATYGYAIVNNRLFVIMGLTSEDLDLNDIFFRDTDSKSFPQRNMPPTGILKNPKWFYEYKDGLSTQIQVLDLDILDK